jgi:hypothetical protein
MPMTLGQKIVYIIFGLGLALLILGIVFLFINWIISVILWAVMFIIHIVYYYYFFIKAKVSHLTLCPSSNGDCVVFLFAVINAFVIASSVSIILL